MLSWVLSIHSYFNKYRVNWIFLNVKLAMLCICKIDIHNQVRYPVNSNIFFKSILCKIQHFTFACTDVVNSRRSIMIHDPKWPKKWKHLFYKTINGLKY